MPMVNGQKYPYTEEGKKQAKKAQSSSKSTKKMPSSPKMTAIKKMLGGMK